MNRLVRRSGPQAQRERRGHPRTSEIASLIAYSLQLTQCASLCHHLRRATQRAGAHDPVRSILYDETKLRLFLEDLEKVTAANRNRPLFCVPRSIA